jgi:hypothetical protein
MKKIKTFQRFLLILAMLFSFCGCENNGTPSDTSPSPDAQSSHDSSPSSQTSPEPSSSESGGFVKIYLVGDYGAVSANYINT